MFLTEPSAARLMYTTSSLSVFASFCVAKGARSFGYGYGIQRKFFNQSLSNLPAVMQTANGTKVLVGPENVAQELKDTSVVMTKFDIGDGMQGMIGVVGPTRMDYAKVTARLSYFAESLSKMFAKPDQPALPGGAEEPQKEA